MNFGGALTGLVGSGGPGGAFSPQAQELQKKQQQDAATAKVLQQYVQKQQAMQAQGGQGGQPQGQGGFAGQMPPLDKMIDMLGQSGLPADQQFEALKNYGAFASPFERMMNQMDMKQMQMQNQQQMLDQRYDYMKQIASMNNQFKGDQGDKNRESHEDLSNTKVDTGALEKEYQGARSHVDALVNALGTKAFGTPEYIQAKADLKAAKEALDSAHKGGTKPAAKASPEQAPVAEVPVPDEMKSVPDGSTVPDENGKLWKKQGDKLVPAG